MSHPPWTSQYKINTHLSFFIKKNILPEMYKRYFLNILEDHEDNHEVYTDAFITQNGVGISIIFEN